ncbi:hypothetical protein Vadar_017109 [Vaccinium darrowii]|uniref:Uncharacterized protein n=1 Tax=Vaccinium darrowii TaxID=229202 RepID=A0ACB7X1C6_9ERIC|nr:hypothetical protein Vadar_017109 [Vaccinium darrowii]
MFDLIGFINDFINLTLLAPFLLCLIIIAVSFLLIIKNSSPQKIFLVDFACYKPPESQTITKEGTVALAVECYGNILRKESVDFMRNMIQRSGLGEYTYLPEAFLKRRPNASMEDGRSESQLAIFGAVDKLLAKTRVEARDIGILVVNCGLFCVTPSLSSIVVNRYKMKEGVVSYNLSGMGCTAGLLAINLAKHLLQVHHNCYALVVSTESISQQCYTGNDPSKILINCAFRVGGAAMLLSNRPSDQYSSKYQLLHTIHTHTANSDKSYGCITMEEDAEGHLGVTVNKDLLSAAVKAIQSNIASLAPLILPVPEQVRYLLNYITRRLPIGVNIEPYIPDFKRGIDHFLAHVGGKPVLDALQNKLGFTEGHMEASRMTLYRYGNTSSSSVWYALAYVEAKRRISRGDRVWQMGFGSGFKVCSVIWRAIRSVDPRDEANANVWSDEIDKFPVDANDLRHNSPLYFSPN